MIRWTGNGESGTTSSRVSSGTENKVHPFSAVTREPSVPVMECPCYKGRDKLSFALSRNKLNYHNIKMSLPSHQSSLASNRI